ncbi:MAG: hypothetical protein FD123_1755 [Bacteroidetes bacterium]|nr:MAG: hypothetical protein FD123_1755 [Bacteroidota bacterium]
MAFDCYKMLDIPPDTNGDEIRRAFRHKAKEFHPDVNQSPEAGAIFRELKEALETLTDPARRHAHDARFGYHRQKKKGEQNLYSINEADSEKAKAAISQWEKSQSLQRAAAERKKQELLNQYRKRRRMLLLAILGIGWLVFLLIWILS